LLERDSGADHLVRGEISKVLVCETTDFAPRLEGPFDGAIAVAIDCSLFRRQHARSRGNARRGRSSIVYLDGLSSERVRVVTPEGVEHLIERPELFVTLDQQRATGVEDFVARIEVDVVERLGQVEDSADRDIEAYAPQQPAEDDQVLNETSAIVRRV
jgi:hypothetical protein